MPRCSLGPDVLQMALGSEGILGVVTEVVVRLRVRAAALRARAWIGICALCVGVCVRLCAASPPPPPTHA